MISATLMQAIIWPALILSAVAPLLLIWLVYRDIRNRKLW